MPDNFYHPMFVHLPLVLPFITLYFLLRIDFESPEKSGYIDLIFLSAVQFLSTVKAYYSGVFRADAIYQDLSEDKIGFLEWHTASGRIYLWLAALSLCFMILLKFAGNKRQRVWFINLVVIVVLVILSICSGYTGGYLVHG